ncbi:unnamed protein product, partial [marine sediment metagenome]
NRSIQSVDGLVVRGKPCKLENKDDWMAEIPLFWKIHAINEIYRQVNLKNS